jgi:hypothetical protein
VVRKSQVGSTAPTRAAWELCALGLLFMGAQPSVAAAPGLAAQSELPATYSQVSMPGEGARAPERGLVEEGSVIDPARLKRAGPAPSGSHLPYFVSLGAFAGQPLFVERPVVPIWSREDYVAGS